MQTPRGYSLPLVMLLIAILSSATIAAVIISADTAEVTGAALNRREAFYACDGAGRAAVVAAEAYMNTTTTPDTNGVKTAVCGSTATPCAQAAKYAPSGFTIDTLDLSTSGSSSVAPLPNGPFTGMNARQTDVTVTVEGTKNGASSARCRVSNKTLLGEVALFQFFVFADGYMDVNNGPAMDINGRVHVNGNFEAAPCTSPLTMSKVTASGRIKHSTSGFGKVQHCALTTVSILDATSNTQKKLVDGNESACAACNDGSGSDPNAGQAWKSYAQARWGGNVQDVEMNVPTLTMPFVGSAAVPDGVDASGGGIDNSKRMRALVDPVRAADSSGIAAQKLAQQADIRIINGVWYYNDGTAWPGKAIWSDHPGNFTTGVDATADPEGIEPSNKRVGQAQLKTDLAWAAVPSHFSYYATDAATATATLTAGAATNAVLSYGSVVCTAAGVCTPGFFKGAGNTDSYCKLAGNADGIFNAATTDPTAATPLGCGDSKNVSRALNYIAGTRSGFQDFRVRSGVSQSQGKIIPVNFDVAAFNTALNTLTAGELGSYFTSKAFNGIIFIANTWTGEMNNFSSANTVQAPPTLWPVVDTAVAGTVEPPVSNSLGAGITGVNKLPYPLCSPTASLANKAYTNPNNLCTGVNEACDTVANAVKTFRVPPCTFGADNIVGNADDPSTRPNALRVINAATINPTTFPKGLSIVTNGPVYIEGDTNTASCTTPSTCQCVGAGCNPMLTKMSSGGNWRPLMIAGDATTFLSNGWSDEKAHWQLDGQFASGARTPTPTNYVVATIAGNVETSATAWGGGINNFPRFLEKWSANPGGGAPEIKAHIVGSLVIAFRSAYARQPWDTDTGSGATHIEIYNPPDRDWDYDVNLALPADQPPGTPTFFVQAIQAWTRD